MQLTEWHRRVALDIAQACPLVPAARKGEREPPFTEQQLQQADLDYLNNQAQREERRVREAHQMDLDRMRREGVL